MGDPRLRIFIKVTLDTVFIILYVSIFFVEIFRYMNDYYITPLSIIKETDYKIFTDNNVEDTPLTQMIIASFSDFDDKFCGSNTTSDIEPVCDKHKDFETAGILYLTFSSTAISLVIYGIFSLFGMACGCSCFGLLKLTFVHYLYPVINAIGLVLYITVSKAFSLDVPSEYSDDKYKMKIETGMILMFAAQFLSIISCVYFFCYRSQLRSLILITHEGYIPSKA